MTKVWKYFEFCRSVMCSDVTKFEADTERLSIQPGSAQASRLSLKVNKAKSAETLNLTINNNKASSSSFAASRMDFC